MPGKLTLHPPERASRFVFIKDGDSILIGRDPQADLVLEDPRISKRHARMVWAGGSWSLQDLESKNGTLINGVPTAGQLLRDADWISFGGLVARFDSVSEAIAAHQHQDRVRRLQTAHEMRYRLGLALEPCDLLLRFLQSAIELTGTERGFVITRVGGGTLRAVVAAGFSHSDACDERFGGSASAVRRVFESGTPLVVSNAQGDTWLRGRPSVVDQALATLACVPLRHDDRLLGALYVDGRKPGPGFTELDLEIIEALADQAAITLATTEIESELRTLLRAGRVTEDDRAIVDAIEKRVASSAIDHGRRAQSG